MDIPCRYDSDAVLLSDISCRYDSNAVLLSALHPKGYCCAGSRCPCTYCSTLAHYDTTICSYLVKAPQPVLMHKNTIYIKNTLVHSLTEHVMMLILSLIRLTIYQSLSMWMRIEMTISTHNGWVVCGPCLKALSHYMYNVRVQRPNCVRENLLSEQNAGECFKKLRKCSDPLIWLLPHTHRVCTQLPDNKGTIIRHPWDLKGLQHESELVTTEHVRLCTLTQSDRNGDHNNNNIHNEWPLRTMIYNACMPVRGGVIILCTMLNQRPRLWTDVVQMLVKCFVFTGVVDKATCL